MKVAILSDTHNHLANLQKALRIVEEEKIQTIIHCGDVTTVETALLLSPYQVILAYGNGDFNSGEIRDTLMRNNPASFAGPVFQGDLDNLRIAVTHGHLVSTFQNLLNCRQFDLIFFGHSHRREERIQGNTRLINPGALGGLKKEERSFCILDTHNRQIRFVLIE
ncbi:MAG: YfcE family phosphodiesterase [Chloroflexota bacterium]|nr:MAG: phosphodiesterase [Bellilinea sp.]